MISTISSRLRLLQKAWIETRQLCGVEKMPHLYFFIDYVLAYIRHGVLIKQYVHTDFYKYKNFERAKIFTYRRWEKLIGKMNSVDYIHFLENKVDFNNFFKDFVFRRWMYVKSMTEKQLFNMLSNLPSGYVIVKPINGWEGHGVERIDLKNISAQKLYDSIKGKNLIIEECIENHPLLNFSNTSVNTIRIYTLMDSHNEVHVLRAILRVGVGSSVVDNYCSGGCIYNVNVAYGYVDSEGIDVKGKHYVVHPGTHIKMLGYQLPEWNKVIDVVKRAGAILPQCRFIGWDVAITPHAVELIEGNHNPDYELLEFLGYHGSFKEIKRILSN